MAFRSAAALAALILCSMTLLATATRPVATNKATQATLRHQAVPAPAPHDNPPVLLQPAAARKLLASTPTFDRDLEDRSKAVTNPLLQSAYKKFEADQAADGIIVGTPFRRLLASTPTFDRDLEDRSKAVTNPLLQSAYKKFEADQAADGVIVGTPFRRLQASTPTFDRDLEDRSKAVTNPTLEAAYKTFEAAAATGDAPGEALPFRSLLSDRDRKFMETERQDHAAQLTANPLLEKAYEQFEADARPDALPFRRLLARDSTSDRELEDRSQAVTNPLLQSAYKRFEADQAADGVIASTPFRKLAAAA